MAVLDLVSVQYKYMSFFRYDRSSFMVS